MKKRFLIVSCALILVVSVFKFSDSASATTIPTATSSATAVYSTGTAIIPEYLEGTGTRTSFNMSNITDNPIDVTIIFYNPDGTLVTDDNSPTTGRISFETDFISNYSDQNTNSSLTFTLKAHCSLTFKVNPTTLKNKAYGLIQWKQLGSTQKGLVVHGSIITETTTSSDTVSVPVNGGLPF